MSQHKQYFHMLSALRGVAAILIVLRHTTAFWTFRFPMSFMAVDVFFLLSGVVLEANYRNRLRGDLTPWHFIWIRLARIYPLYILGTLISVLTIMVARDHQLFNGAEIYIIPHQMMAFLLSMFLLPNLFRATPGEFPFDGPAWSLFFEISVNILYGFIAIKMTTRRTMVLTLACGIGLLLALGYYHSVELGWMRETIPGGVLRTAFSFFLGVLLYRARLRYGARLSFIGRGSDVIQWLVIAGAVLLLMSPAAGRGELFVYVLAVFLLFPMIVFVALLLEPRARTRRLFDFLGDVSYPVYTLQVPCYLLLCSVVFPAVGVPVEAVSSWFGYVFLAGLIAVSYALDRRFDRPAQRFLRSLWKPRKVAAEVAELRA